MIVDMHVHNIVDCEWNDWNIGTCTKSCGGGTRTNTRTTKDLADHGGKECDGVASLQENCNSQPCPGYI